MTAINVIVTPKIGYMVSDSIAYDQDGIIVGFGAKVFTLPHSLSVFAARGHTDVCRCLGEILGGFHTFDQIEEHAPEALRVAMVKIQEQLGPQSFEVICMGWSHRSSCARAVIGSSDDNFNFVSGSPILAPMLSPAEFVEYGISLTDDPVTDLLEIITAQRQIIASSGPDEHGHYGAIGGAVILTTVAAGGIVQRAVMGWADQIGSRVQVEKSNAVPGKAHA